MDPMQDDKCKDRPGDQPMPTGSDRHPHAHAAAADRLMARSEVGERRYGRKLRPWNGRDPVQDLEEEILDAAAYVQNVRWQFNDLAARLGAIQATLDAYDDTGLRVRPVDALERIRAALQAPPRALGVTPAFRPADR